MVYYTMLYYTILCHVIPYYSMLNHAILYDTILYYSIIQHTFAQYSTVLKLNPYRYYVLMYVTHIYSYTAAILNQNGLLFNCFVYIQLNVCSYIRRTMFFFGLRDYQYLVCTVFGFKTKTRKVNGNSEIGQREHEELRSKRGCGRKPKMFHHTY